jgi:subtilase family serine protease
LEDRLVLTGTATPTGLTPAQLLHAYGIDQIRFNQGTVAGDGSGQTIAIIVGGDNPDIAADVHGFDQQFGLPDPVLTRVAADGSTIYPPVNSTWVTESLLDVEWAHAVAPRAQILLVEADASQDATSFANFIAAVDYARKQPGVTVVSMSYAKTQFAAEVNSDSHFTTPAGHAGITFLAATGDRGTPAGYPAASPNVVGVGGTVLQVNLAGDYLGETGWNSSGGGLSTYEAQPGYQQGVVGQSATQRASPDVALDAGTAVSVYDIRNGAATPWGYVAGTSLATPLWAGLIALADQGRAASGLGSLDGPTQTLPALYQLPAADFHDITGGDNPSLAGPGFDLVTGRGSPIANLLVPDLVKFASSVTPPPAGNPNPNPPVLTYASSNPTSTTILGAFTGQPSTTYTLQFSTVSGQTTSPLAQATVTTDITGSVSLYVYVKDPVTPGLSVKATAADSQGNVSAASASVTVVQSPSGSVNDAFVAQVYLDLMHRPADPKGLANWVSFLNQGGARAQVIQGFLASPEYQIDVIKQLYLQVLHRTVDAPGLDNWVSYMQAGHSRWEVEASLLGSEEYFSLHGNSRDGFLQGIYQDVLGRAADATGKQTFLGALGTGQTAAQVAAVILTSPEADEDLVAANYLQFLHRPVESMGLNAWAQVLAKGMTAEQLIAGLMSSDEYLAAV